VRAPAHGLPVVAAVLSVISAVFLLLAGAALVLPVLGAILLLLAIPLQLLRQRRAGLPARP
jgi:hypothetical protein